MGEFYSPITLRIKECDFCSCLKLRMAILAKYWQKLDYNLGEIASKSESLLIRDMFFDGAFGTIFPRLGCPFWAIGKPK